jgi:hypothetical protein
MFPPNSIIVQTNDSNNASPVDKKTLDSVSKSKNMKDLI